MGCYDTARASMNVSELESRCTVIRTAGSNRPASHLCGLSMASSAAQRARWVRVVARAVVPVEATTRCKVESKQDMRKRGIRSPDLADASPPYLRISYEAQDPITPQASGARAA